MAFLSLHHFLGQNHVGAKKFIMRVNPPLPYELETLILICVLVR